MAALTEGAKKERKGKKPHKNKPTSKKYASYIISGEGIKKKRNCPRCGPGIFLAEHNNRLHCGKCGYTEFAKK